MRLGLDVQNWVQQFTHLQCFDVPFHNHSFMPCISCEVVSCSFAPAPYFSNFNFLPTNYFELNARVKNIICFYTLYVVTVQCR